MKGRYAEGLEAKTQSWFPKSTRMMKKILALFAQVVLAPARRFIINRFTPRAQQVLRLAREEAARFNHNYVGTEHLLLGLIKLGEGVAVNVLQKMGLNLETIRMEVEKQVGSGPEKKIAGSIPYTPRVKKVLARVGWEAKSLNHTYVGAEHLLLGILREGTGVAHRILINVGLDLERTRTEIRKELDPNATPDA